MGGFALQLSHLYPKLNFVIQDRGPVIQQAERTVWAKEAPEALSKGRVSFVEHDFFTPNPVTGAGVYWLRYIMQVIPFPWSLIDARLCLPDQDMLTCTGTTGQTNTASRSFRPLGLPCHPHRGF